MGSLSTMIILQIAYLTGILMLMPASSNAGRLKSDQTVLNVCMDGRHHVPKPIKTQLYGLCKGWESNSCCVNQTAFHAQQPFSLLYNYNHSQCGPLSDKCQRRFYLSNCFYECSPNVGPWLIPDKSVIRNERLYHVPVCANDCEAWWNDCRDQQTCTDDFVNGFSWKTGTNKCPTGSECKKFQEWFPNSTSFCENIYPHDYRVQLPDSKYCMKFDFQGSENPNAKVAEYYAKQKGLHVPEHASETATTRSGLYDPEHANDTAMTQSDAGIVPVSSIPCRSDAVIPMTVIIVLLAASTTGLLWCKCRDMQETSRRARTSYFSGIGWFRKKGTAARICVHHRERGDDQQFLREAEDEDDSVLNPHGTLEINL